MNFLLHNGFVFEKLTVLDVKDQPELEEGKILELNITTKSKIAQNSSNGNEIKKTNASRYALRVPINQITEIKINNEEYWDPENHTFTKEPQGKE